VIPGAVTMIGVTAMQDARERAAANLRLAALIHADTYSARVPLADSIADLMTAARALEDAAREFARADQALELVTAAAREATEASAARRAGGKCAPRVGGTKSGPARGPEIRVSDGLVARRVDLRDGDPPFVSVRHVDSRASVQIERAELAQLTDLVDGKAITDVAGCLWRAAR